MEDVINRIGWALTTSGVALALGGWFAYVTGDEVFLRSPRPAPGGSMRTHMDATIVLLVLGLVVLGNGVVALRHARRLSRARLHARPADTGRDWHAGS